MHFCLMYQTLKDLCEVFAPSGDESRMKDFLLDYISKNQSEWVVQPEIIAGDEWHDNVILVFGEPRTAIFAHIDSIGFTVRYENQLVPIGGPDVQSGYFLRGEDSKGEILCRLEMNKEGNLFYHFGRAIDRGTNLVFESNFRETDEYVQSCYLDNRLGVLNALKVAETLENGIIVFSTREEHGGGAVPQVAKFIYEKYGVRQALISDITWVTDGVHHGKGVAISMRDRGLPRRTWLNRILKYATDSGIAYQLEIEGSGSSDARELQESDYPFDWCFIGAPEDHVHSPEEKVFKFDFESMINMYQYLMKKL
ncbi:aminopeptidase [Mangrovivirga cuniculi]|uniref:Aminopeptidase n=2 Tax=Mangrovivirga cuniculi TaxID=2715131 RepID=A0A4D7JF56_9BACT|nr:aminopeptidase [Mangrovivirga cuniculi]